MKDNVSGSCAAIFLTRGLIVKLTSTISSSVGSQSSAQRTHLYSACFTVLSVAPESRTPPQAGQRIFQDISKMQSRAACRKAAITSSSSSLCLAAKARALIRQRSRSAPAWISFSIARTGFGFADCRKALKRESVSSGRFMALSDRSHFQVPCGQEKRKASDRCAEHFFRESRSLLSSGLRQWFDYRNVLQ